MKSKLIMLMALLATLALAACGSDDEKSTTSSSKPNGVDRAFVAAMIPHHESAVEMAEIAQERGQSAFVKSLAADIIRTQNAEIETLRAKDAELADAGIEEGDLGVPEHMMGMDADMGALETADPFDEAFMEMMIPHHEGAVTMAEAELEKGGDTELKDLAEQIISAQEKEISEMQNELGVSGDSGHSAMEDHGG